MPAFPRAVCILTGGPRASPCSESLLLKEMPETEFTGKAESQDCEVCCLLCIWSFLSFGDQAMDRRIKATGMPICPVKSGTYIELRSSLRS